MMRAELLTLMGHQARKLSVFLCLGGLACAPLKIFDDDPDHYEQRPPDATGEYTPFAVTDRVISETKYKIDVYPVHTYLTFGPDNAICSGEAIVKLHYPEPRFEITENSFKISCLGLPFTPKQIQPSTVQPLDGRGPGKGRLSSTIKSHACLVSNGCNDKAGKQENLLILKFSPAVPYYLPSIVQNPAELDKLGELKQVHKVTFSDDRPEVIGSSRVKIISTKEKMKPYSDEFYKPKDVNGDGFVDVDANGDGVIDAPTQKSQTIAEANVGSNFAFDVVHWERELTGFEEYPPQVGGLLPMIGYKHMEWWSSLRPIAMVKFRIRAPLISILGTDYVNSLDERKRNLINSFKDNEVVLQFHMISFNEM